MRNVHNPIAIPMLKDPGIVPAETQEQISQVFDAYMQQKVQSVRQLIASKDPNICGQLQHQSPPGRMEQLQSYIDKMKAQLGTSYESNYGYRVQSAYLQELNQIIPLLQDCKKQGLLPK